MTYYMGMRSIYLDSSVPEKIAKEKYSFPEFIMMENAAMALEAVVMNWNSENIKSVIILCGTGNNGGDGYALARRIYKKLPFIQIISFGEPKTSEAVIQKKMASSLGIKIWNYSDFQKKDISKETLVVDCIYGTGFHGELKSEVAEYIDFYNKQNCLRLACDIPSGIDIAGHVLSKNKNGEALAFFADKTVTMGALKLALFSDKAKDFVGAIKSAELGISDCVFEECHVSDCYLIEEKDVKLPVREKKSAHKGNFGHTSVIIGEKPGAGIIAGTAALKIGSGLVTLVEEKDESHQFLMNPELMISNNLPEKTSSILLGSGYGKDFTGINFNKVLDYIKSLQVPAVVFDADFFYYGKIYDVLTELNSKEKSNVILTPHPKELACLLKATMPDVKEIADYDEKAIIENRFEFACLFAKRFPNITLIAKGANTVICAEGNAYIYDAGSVALAKAGSGDVLAGLCAGLLAQGYSSKDAAITAVWLQGTASQRFAYNYECTPLTLIEKISENQANVSSKR